MEGFPRQLQLVPTGTGEQRRASCRLPACLFIIQLHTKASPQAHEGNQRRRHSDSPKQRPSPTFRFLCCEMLGDASPEALDPCGLRWPLCWWQRFWGDLRWGRDRGGQTDSLRLQEEPACGESLPQESGHLCSKLGFPLVQLTSSGPPAFARVRGPPCPWAPAPPVPLLQLRDSNKSHFCQCKKGTWKINQGLLVVE